MKQVRITAVRKAAYKDLSEKYENPIEHACDLVEDNRSGGINGRKV